MFFYIYVYCKPIYSYLYIDIYIYMCVSLSLRIYIYDLPCLSTPYYLFLVFCVGPPVPLPPKTNFFGSLAFDTVKANFQEAQKKQNR